jgi:hypothetical protein
MSEEITDVNVFEEEFIKLNLIEKWSALIKDLQEDKIKEQLIGSSVKAPLNTASQDLENPVNVQDVVGKAEDVNFVIGKLRSIQEYFKDKYATFLSDYEKAVKEAVTEKNLNQIGGDDDDDDDGYTKMKEDIKSCIQEAYDAILGAFKECEDTMNNQMSIHDVTAILNNTAFLVLFTRINSIYTTSLISMIKKLKLDGFNLSGQRNLLREYLNEKIRDLPELKNLSLERYNKRLKEVNIVLNDIIPRTETMHVPDSLHKVTYGGSRKKFDSTFQKYKRSDLNKLAKKMGLKKPEKLKNKKMLGRVLQTIVFFKAGGYSKRNELNQVAKLVDVNPKSYKTKKDLLRKLNKTIF